jgi:hypothetical protein
MHVFLQDYISKWPKNDQSRRLGRLAFFIVSKTFVANDLGSPTADGNTIMNLPYKGFKSIFIKTFSY